MTLFRLSCTRLCAVIAYVTFAFPGTVLAASTAERLMHDRAVEAIIWSMPAISEVFFRESLFRDYGMKPGDVMVMSRPLVARHEVLTANNQVNYAVIAFDLTKGPMVVEIPASSADYAVIGEICDNWQAPVTMIGVEGPDEGKVGKYLLLPPEYKETPPAGYILIRFDGFRGTMVFRPVAAPDLPARESNCRLLPETADVRTTAVADVGLRHAADKSRLKETRAEASNSYHKGGVGIIGTLSRSVMGVRI